MPPSSGDWAAQGSVGGLVDSGHRLFGKGPPFQRADLERGLEPDRCYYIRHEAAIRDREHIDFDFDPPPDLVIEINHTAMSLDKMVIYAAMGVPEVWRWQAERLEVHVLTEGRYRRRKTSLCLPGFPFPVLTDALSRRHELDETTLTRRFRKSLTQRL
jgi:hypothetical protein